ncbi:MAG: DUF2274 domain-containing protein [Gammaproteobacteria bacterium]
MKLRLGPLPKTDTVKMTIAVPIALKAQLDQYAQVHSSTWHETVDASTLIPHMLEQFIARDRGFRAACKSRDSAPSTPASDAGTG